MLEIIVPIIIGCLSLIFTSFISIRQILIPLMLIINLFSIYMIQRHLKKKETLTRKNVIIYLIASYLIMHMNLFPISNITWKDYLGVFIWGFSYFIMANSIKNKRERMFTLFNKKFFVQDISEIISWIGFYIIVLNVPYGWVTIIAPISITISKFF